MKMLALGVIVILAIAAVNLVERWDQWEMKGAAAECRKALGHTSMLLVRQVGEGYVCAVPKFFISREQARANAK